VIFYWVNQQGKICLGVGALLGFLGAGLGKLAGSHIGLGEGGFVLGVVVGALTIIAVDVAFRVRAFLNDECSLIGAFVWPSYGGTVNGCHASFDGLLFLALGLWLTSISYDVQAKAVQDQARKLAGQQEVEHLARITQRLPRAGIDVSVVGDKKGIYTITLTNKTGKDLSKVQVKTRAHYMGGDFTQTLEWPEWKDGEAKTFTDPGRGSLADFGFEMEGYPPGASEPRFLIINFGFVSKGKWEPSPAGK
jgi:hypothetical protein